MKHLTERPDLRKLPPRLRPVIGRALEKDPARRQASMTELLRSFEDAVLGRTSTSSEPHPANARYDEVPPDRIRYRPVVRAEHHRRDRGRHWERAGKSRWRYAGAPSHPSELFFATLKWVILAVVFHWIGWGFFVPVTLTLAAVFGIMFVMRLIRWSIFGLADGVHGAFREAQFAASKIGWAAQYAAGAAVAAPRAVGNAAGAARGFCTKRFHGAAERPATTTLMRWTQWTGTAAVTTLVAGAFTAVLAVVWPRFAPLPNALTPTEWPELMMFAATVVLASWGITAVTKFWDGTRSRLLPRLSLGLVGLAVGAGVWNLEHFLHVGLISQPSLFDFGTNPVIASYASDIRVDRELLSTMVFFGLLFFARNWLRQTSVNRSSRLRLSSLIFTALVAAVVGGLMESRNIELMMTWAAVVSATVQVASAWSPAEKISRQAA
jgi:serine/threonine-protein kinase